MDAYERECYRLQLLEDLDYYFDRKLEDFAKWRAEKGIVTTNPDPNATAQDKQRLVQTILEIQEFWESNENAMMYEILMEEWDRYEFDSRQAEHD